MSQNSAETTWQRRNAERIEHVATRHRFIYSILISLLALIGYAYLFLFPAGVVFGIAFLVDAIPRAAASHDWEKIGAMISVVLLCAVTCLHILRLRQPPSAGLPLEPEQVPELFRLMESLRKRCGHRRIRQVLLTDNYQLEMRNTPVVGLPLWFSHTLVIGLPLLQTVAPKHFRCALARRLCQHAHRGHRITHRLFLARQLWNSHLEVLTRHPRFGDQLLRWFFRAYAPLFHVLSLPAVRWDELAADSATLDIINDNDVFETIKVTTLGSLFLDVQYWPKLRRMALKEGERQLTPFAKLEQLICPALQKIDANKWLNDMAGTGLDAHSPMPDFRRRMHNIGHAKIRGIPRISATAAGLYLKDAQSLLIPAIDKLWQTSTLPAWLAEYETRREDIETIRALSAMSHQGRLTLAEIWRYARLAKRLQGRPRHRSILKLLRRNSSHAGLAGTSADGANGERLNDVF